jgi:hypothetical protein
LITGYNFDQSIGIEGGYESLMGYEMTLLSVSALGRYRVADHIHLLGLLGMSYWTESPTGKYKASGVDPLLGLGLSYSLTTQVPQLIAQVIDWPAGEQAKMTQQSGDQGFGSISASNRASCSGVVLLTPR